MSGGSRPGGQQPRRQPAKVKKETLADGWGDVAAAKNEVFADDDGNNADEGPYRPKN